MLGQGGEVGVRLEGTLRSHSSAVRRPVSLRDPPARFLHPTRGYWVSHMGLHLHASPLLPELFPALFFHLKSK